MVGASENADMRGPSEADPYEVDVDERRVVSAYCCTCGKTAGLLLEVGDDSPWEHDEKHASHMVDYWMEMSA
ncbi:hypothetical protein [Halorubrum sp. C191]|uniref:hypothetical protein n=1 Tax=Halorubrum sp. C191 TaxID=1383842 RepID=UPI0026895647|nr:hypothetical protein [Halorubrum sp. C191]